MLAILRDLAAPARDASRDLMIDLAVRSLAAVLVLTGGGFLLTAGFRLLSRHLGEDAALVVTGLGLMALAGFILLVRKAYRRQVVRPNPAPQVVFDMFFNFGRSMPKRPKN